MSFFTELARSDSVTVTQNKNLKEIEKKERTFQSIFSIHNLEDQFHRRKVVNFKDTNSIGLNFIGFVSFDKRIPFSNFPPCVGKYPQVMGHNLQSVPSLIEFIHLLKYS